MNPPPSTPTPRRFLLPKRTPGASQASVPPQASQQFQSTPKFGSSSRLRQAQKRAQDVEDVDEDADESSEFDDGASTGNDDDATEVEVERVAKLSDSIEVGSDVGTDSQPSDALLEETTVFRGNATVDDGNLQARESPPQRRQVKRRRVSISPAGTCFAFENESALGVTSTMSQEYDQNPSSEHGDGDIDESRAQDAAQPQPIFHPAPRFKPIEHDSPIADILPDAFSPRRRGGPKYLPNGLAAHLQSWLSDVKSWEGTESTASSVLLRVTVDEIRPGGHMYLVRGKTMHAEERKCFMLAGEGKLTGLDRKAAVDVGSVVVLEEPVWEVKLAGESWTVGCNWSVGHD